DQPEDHLADCVVGLGIWMDVALNIDFGHWRIFSRTGTVPERRLVPGPSYHPPHGLSRGDIVRPSKEVAPLSTSERSNRAGSYRAPCRRAAASRSVTTAARPSTSA